MSTNRGVILALLAGVMWGLFPVYWKLLKSVSPFEILAHRIFWSLIFTTALIHFLRGWSWLARVYSSTDILLRLIITSILISVNWLGFIWAVNAGYILECSLGYFICPLVSVFFGFAFLGERLRPMQTVAVLLAAIGVFLKSYQYGSLPWISLLLAVSFALYAVFRKTAKVDSLEGLFLETLVMAPLALVFLGSLWDRGELSFGSNASDNVSLLLIFSGVATALPLLCYAGAARLLSLATLGVLQYVAPTLQFLLAVFVYGESFAQADLVGFALIWVALALYTFEGVSYSMKLQRTARISVE